MIIDIFGQNIMIIIRNDSMEEDRLGSCSKLDYFYDLFSLLLLFFLDIFVISLGHRLRLILFLGGFLFNYQVFNEPESSRLLSNALPGLPLGFIEYSRYFSILKRGSFFLFKGFRVENIERDPRNSLLAMFSYDDEPIIFFYFEPHHSDQQIPFCYFLLETEILYFCCYYTVIVDCILHGDRSYAWQHWHSVVSILIFLDFFIDWFVIVQSHNLFLQFPKNVSSLAEARDNCQDHSFRKYFYSSIKQQQFYSIEIHHKHSSILQFSSYFHIFSAPSVYTPCIFIALID